jgi:protein-tyrosine kinase
MSRRRGDNRGGGGDDQRPEVFDRQDLDKTKVDASVPPARALAVPRRGQILVPDSRLPKIAARLPTGMASADQIDSFRELRTRLLGMASSLGLGYFTTLVVPMVPSSGASFVARNLAAAFTLQDHQMALLVDCNLRHPTQHQALGIRADENGLFDFLEQPHAAIDQLVRPTGISGLHLIPAGRPPSRPREYFSSPGMRMLMSALRQETCYTFLDGPPTKGSPDARILSELADFVILVLGYGSATTETIVQTAAMFDPTKFAGVVFNERT